MTEQEIVKRQTDALERLNQLNVLFEALKSKAKEACEDGEIGGPMGTLFESVESILGESFQGSNQACTDPPDTLWTIFELEAFVLAVTGNLHLLQTVIDEARS